MGNAEFKRENRQRRSDVLLETFAWLCVFVAFAPAAYWLWDALSHSRQLRDALVILASGAVAVALEGGVKFQAPKFNFPSILCLGAAYTLFLLAPNFGIGAAFAVLAGLSAALVSFSLACTDKPRYSWAIGVSFYVFTILSLLARMFDMPLRVWGGFAASKILNLFAETSSLVLMRGAEPQIILQNEGQPFVVAAECNGFGIISSVLLIGIFMAVFMRGIALWGRFLIPIIAVAIGFFANAVRMVCIVVAAPYVGNANYDLMHEIFGYFWFSVAVISVILLCFKVFPRASAPKEKT